MRRYLEVPFDATNDLRDRNVTYIAVQKWSSTISDMRLLGQILMDVAVGDVSGSPGRL